MGVCRGRMELRLGQPLYPSMVAELPDPPKTIYVRGDPTALNASCISIIGSRKATPYGLAVAEMAAHVAAESNLVVVSGGALGCDQAAGRKGSWRRAVDTWWFWKRGGCRLSARG